MRNVIKEVAPLSDETKVFSIHKMGNPHMAEAHVWMADGGHFNCTACSGPLVAMSSSCKHVAAVKRHVATLRAALGKLGEAAP